MEPDTFPCFRCVFCNTLFGSLKTANFHLDHYLQEYCTAYDAELAVLGFEHHPVAAIREFRRKANRKRFIAWNRATVRPVDGTTWTFVVPVETEADYRATLKYGLKPAAWWTKRLCEPLPKPSASASSSSSATAASRAAPAPPFVNKISFKRVSQINSFSTEGPSRSKRVPTIDADFEDDDDEEPESDIAPQTPVHRPARRRRRVYFPEVSPFMRPGPPAPLTALEVHVFGRVYPVSVTRKMTLAEALDGLQALLTVRLDMEGFGLAEKDGGECWTDAEWDALKRAWMMGGKTEAWLVAVG